MADHAEPENPQGLTDGAQANQGLASVFISYASHDLSVARAFVLVLSESSIDSSHVGKEIERASSKKRPIIRQFLISASLLLAMGSADCLAQMGGPGMGGPGQMSGPTHGARLGDESSTTAPGPSSASDLAVAAYKAGVGYISKAKDADSDAAKAADDKKRTRALAKASNLYDKALDRFEDAVDKDPGMVDAWNDIGLCELHLGFYDEAVMAYANVLELKPDYGEAYENRAEAYLGLNKIAKAKSDYMTLFNTARPLADQLMTYMHQWIDERQRDPKGVSSDDLAAFVKWTDERASAQQND